MVQKLIGAMLAIVIGLALLPVVLDVVDDILPAVPGDLGVALEAMIALLPVLYVVIIVVGAVGYIAIGRKK